jgi:hypothetical protein
MRRFVRFALLPLALGLIACDSTPITQAPPVTSEQLNSMQEEFQRTDPDARVGMVTAVLPSANLVSVGDVSVNDFTVGDVISFLDSNGKLLAMGKVEAIERSSLDVRYDPATVHHHNPQAGDVAVRAIH